MGAISKGIKKFSEVKVLGNIHNYRITPKYPSFQKGRDDLNSESLQQKSIIVSI